MAKKARRTKNRTCLKPTRISARSASRSGTKRLHRRRSQKAATATDGSTTKMSISSSKWPFATTMSRTSSPRCSMVFSRPTLWSFTSNFWSICCSRRGNGLLLTSTIRSSIFTASHSMRFSILFQV